MDISFHFYAVKIIAMLAGFDAVEAQRIASYSQYVDDYIPQKSYVLDNVPQFAREMVIDNRFYAVQTGFTVLGDNVDLLDQKFQRETIATFHFIPPEHRITRTEYQVKPAHLGDSSMATHILHEAADQYKRSDTAEKRDMSLMFAGIALHIFADTYAHENFNGFSSEVNLAKVTDARINGVQTNPYMRYSHPIDKLAVGHAQVGTAPDDVNTWFEIQQGAKKWQRDNLTAFLECAGEIFDCLAYMKNGEKLGMKRNVEEILRQAFTQPNVKNMPQIWSDIWNGNLRVPYHIEWIYYSKEWMDRVFSPFKAYIGDRLVYRANPDFYYYNFYAKRIRDYVAQILFEG